MPFLVPLRFYAAEVFHHWLTAFCVQVWYKYALRHRKLTDLLTFICQTHSSPFVAVSARYGQSLWSVPLLHRSAEPRGFVGSCQVPGHSCQFRLRARSSAAIHGGAINKAIRAVDGAVQLTAMQVACCFQRAHAKSSSPPDAGTPAFCAARAAVLNRMPLLRGAGTAAPVVASHAFP
jgi:hypothetical protein